MAQVRINTDPISGDKQLIIALEREFAVNGEASILSRALQEAANKVAEDWVEKNRDKILERLNVEAIANLIVLEVAKQTKQDILKNE